MSEIDRYISRNAIACKVKCDDWKDAVRFAGELLLRDGIVEASFIDKMVDYVEEYGPYIVILPGFALAHARPEDGALKTGMSLFTLESPVCFGNEDNDPVSIVIGLASNEKGMHLTCLGDIVRLIDSDDVKSKILSAETPETIFDILGI